MLKMKKNNRGWERQIREDELKRVREKKGLNQTNTNKMIEKR